ncbi:GNAT family N-acetyltransferase [Longispora albida]|uniref:GNAT family N-acetyltransferase n=1 Tax=Longispora albida TaxID=203523 RepID=UPI000373DB49|nr:GNAT family protein [Longispora albida]
MQLRTDIEDLVLRELTIADTEAYHALLQASAGHLTQFGNYEDDLAQSLEDVREYFRNPDDDNYRFGLWYQGELAGRADLNPVNPPHFVLGYWLGGTYTGKGLATAGCEALIRYAGKELAATEIYAGVTHGNDKSVAVLDRLGFEQVAEFEDYTRYRRVL